MPPGRWLADEMVGRLGRYLRFVGCDTLYARGMTDDEILARARAEDRIIVTRDRQLARRASGAVLLRAVSLEHQWRELRAIHPEVPIGVAFLRCTVCNGLLAERPAGGERPPGSDSVPWDRVDRGLPLYRCEQCGHLYWEGSHTAQIRARLERWSREAAP